MTKSANRAVAGLEKSFKLLATYRMGGREVVSHQSERVLLAAGEEAPCLTDGDITAFEILDHAKDLGLTGQLAGKFYKKACRENQTLFTILVMGRRHYRPATLAKIRAAITDLALPGSRNWNSEDILSTGYLTGLINSIEVSYPKIAKAPALKNYIKPQPK